MLEEGTVDCKGDWSFGKSLDPSPTRAFAAITNAE